MFVTLEIFLGEAVYRHPSQEPPPGQGNPTQGKVQETTAAPLSLGPRGYGVVTKDWSVPGLGRTCGEQQVAARAM